MRYNGLVLFMLPVRALVTLTVISASIALQSHHVCAQIAPWSAGGSPNPPDNAQADAGTNTTATAQDASTPSVNGPPPASTTPAFTPIPLNAPSRRAPAPTEFVDPEPYSQTPDPSISSTFAFPTARMLLKGDATLRVGSMLGWISTRYGVNRRLDVGVGLPFALVGISADMRVSLVQERVWALTIWTMIQVPMHPGGTGMARAFFGFNWTGGGPWWTAGPLLTFSGERASFHLGVQLNQRLLMGGLWGLGTVSAEFRLIDGMKAIGQAVIFGEMINENASTLERRSLLSNAQPRVMPYALLGVRVYSRRSAVDLGVLATVGDQSLLAYGPVSVWPFLSGGYWF